MIRYELIHADTCLPDYWGGHHLPHIATPAYPMTPGQLAQALHSELNQGAVMGGHDLPAPDDFAAIDPHYNAMADAIDEARALCTAVMLFHDMPHMDDYNQDDEMPLAFFVFRPVG